MKISIIKKDRLYTVLSFALLLVIWKIISVIVNSAIIIPSPEITLVSLFNLIKTRDFFIIILFSLERGLIGFALSFVLGLLVGFAAGFNRVFNKIFEPFLVIIRSTPVITIILIALIWFKANNVPIFASFLMSFPIICTNVIEGIKNIDPQLLEMAKIYRIKRTRVIKEIYLPSIIPFLTAAISTAFGIGWKVVVAAEVLSQPKYAIGSSLQNSKIYLNINDVFAWTIVAILIGYLFERLIRLIEKKSLKWKREYGAGY
ncbi:MAG TPA: ABC transporter permease [Candidatus Humimicrobiaceae bacterium]